MGSGADIAKVSSVELRAVLYKLYFRDACMSVCMSNSPVAATNRRRCVSQPFHLLPSVCSDGSLFYDTACSSGVRPALHTASGLSGRYTASSSCPTDSEPSHHKYTGATAS